MYVPKTVKCLFTAPRHAHPPLQTVPTLHNNIKARSRSVLDILGMTNNGVQNQYFLIAATLCLTTVSISLFSENEASALSASASPLVHV